MEITERGTDWQDEITQSAPIQNHNLSISGADLQKAVWHERRVELAMEGDRFFDLVRQGRAAEVINNFYKNITSYSLINPFIKG